MEESNMFNKLTHGLLLIASLFVSAISHQVVAAEKTPKPIVTAAQVSTEKININNATDKQLAAIKGIGMKKAKAITDYRQNNGDFVSIEQLLNVKGIGKGTLKKIQPFLTL